MNINYRKPFKWLILLTLLVLVGLSCRYWWRIKKLRHQLAVKRAKVQLLRAQNAYLQDAIEHLGSDVDAQELEARKKWGLIKPGERFYQVQNQN